MIFQYFLGLTLIGCWASLDLFPARLIEWHLHSAINFLKNVPYLMPVVFSNNFGTNQSGFTWESF